MKESFPQPPKTEKTKESIETEQSKDWFIENSPQQPKLEIADYVESMGFLVPERYSFEDGLERANNGESIIFRSEHSDEYAGPSGVAESVVIKNNKVVSGVGFRDGDIARQMKDAITANYPELFEKLLRYNSKSSVEQYCSYKEELNSQEYLSGITWTAWEHKEGENYTIIRDNVVSDRYHVFASIPSNETRDQGGQYFQIDENLVSEHSGVKIGNEDRVLQIINDVYTPISHLDKFDSHNCPIMEIQHSEGENFFLQSHRGRSVEESDFVLERPLEENEYLLPHVRGVTPEEGIIGEMSLSEMVFTHDPQKKIFKHDKYVQ